MNNSQNEIYFSAPVCAKIAEAVQRKDQGSLPDILAGVFREMIMDGTFAPGCKFPNENIMCGLLKIGRGSIREAYRILQMHGVIVRSKSGTSVSFPDSFENFFPFNAGVNKKRFYDIQEYRSMLEVETARLSALRADEGDMDVLANAVWNMRNNLADSYKLTYYDTIFHMQVAEASKNILLKNAMQSTKKLLDNEVFHIFNHDAEIGHRAVDFHQKIFNAIVQKNPIAASSVMADHMSDVAFTLNYMLENKKL
ncbi:MAG: FadR family transcriptional regulator [Deltaproteobacteria bacterium]|jgi:GntR family transcriptional repressor for pyruvate dehydrogenase complex|nr:FadR family transcriptional regulator [Deltaproteobacteria bacterium]